MWLGESLWWSSKDTWLAQAVSGGMNTLNWNQLISECWDVFACSGCRDSRAQVQRHTAVQQPRPGDRRGLELVLHILLFLFRLVLTCKAPSAAVANGAACADRQKLKMMMTGSAGEGHYKIKRTILLTHSLILVYSYVLSFINWFI